MTLPLCMFAVSLCALFSGLYFGLGVHPHRYAIFLVYTTIFPFFNLILILFASRPNVGQKGSGSGNTGGGSREDEGSKTGGNNTQHHHSSSKMTNNAKVETNLGVYSGGGAGGDTNSNKGGSSTFVSSFGGA